MNANVAMHPNPTDEPKLLTAPGASMAIPPDQRDMFAYFSDGRLLVADGQDLEQHVLAFVDNLDRQGRRHTIESCTLDKLREIYGSTNHHGGGAETIQFTAQRQEQAIDILDVAHNKHGASDVHLVGDYGRNRFEVFFRIHGELHPYEPQRGKPFVTDESVYGIQLRTAIYVGLTDVAHPTFRPTVAQDARIAEKYVKRIGLYGARVATTPVDKGQRMVIRLLANPRVTTYEELGYLPEQVAIYQEQSASKNGMGIICGETGSGKSTTLQLQMNMLIKNYRGRIHVVTLEDPPEYEIVGATQIPTYGHFEEAIKSAMRLDPDVLMIAEIRDRPSASAAFRAALTGHGVRSTLHANGPFSALTRLADLGVEPYLYLDPTLLRYAAHQFLLPVLCEHCRISWEDLARADWLYVPDAQRRRIDRHAGEGSVYLRNPEGCSAPGCAYGHTGRTVIARVVKLNQALMDAYAKGGAVHANEVWVKEQGGITHTAHLAARVREGRIDPLVGERFIGANLDSIYD